MKNRIALLLLASLFASGCSRLDVSNFAEYQTNFSGITSVSYLGCNSVTLNWSAASNVTIYSIYNTTSGQAVYLGSVTPPTTQYTVTGLQPATTYQFQVHAMSSQGRADTNVNHQVVTTLGSNCYSSIVLADRPLGFWKLDEAAGISAASDSSGNGYHGTYNAGVTRGVSGPLLLESTTTSAFFDGTGTGTVTLPNSLVIPVNSPITVEFWTYVTTADAAGGHSSFTLGNLTSPNFCKGHVPWSTGQIYWDYGLNTGVGRIWGSYPSSGLDHWTHVVLVSAGALGSLRSIYLNGVILYAENASGGPAVSLTGGFIGGEPIGGSYAKGKISQFAVYNYVLSATQIAAHYRAAGY